MINGRYRCSTNLRLHFKERNIISQQHFLSLSEEKCHKNFPNSIQLGINDIIMQVPKIINEGISALNNDIKKHIYTLIYSTLSLS